MLGPLLNKTFCDDSVLVKILFQDLMQLKMILHLDQFWPDKCALPTYLPTYLPTNANSFTLHISGTEPIKKISSENLH